MVASMHVWHVIWLVSTWVLWKDAFRMVTLLLYRAPKLGWALYCKDHVSSSIYGPNSQLFKTFVKIKLWLLQCHVGTSRSNLVHFVKIKLWKSSWWPMIVFWINYVIVCYIYLYMLLLCCAFIHVHTHICKKSWHCEETQDVNKASVVGIVYTVLLLQVCTHINIGSLFWLFNKLRG